MRKMYVNRREDSTGNGEQMRRECDLVSAEADLLEQFASVAMGEDAVSGEVVCRVMKWVFALGALPAPLTPLLESATMP